MTTSLQAAIVQLGRVVDTVDGYLDGLDGPKQLLRILGWDMPPGVDDIGLGELDLSTLLTSLENLEVTLAAGSDGVDVSIAGVEDAYDGLIETLNTFADGFTAPPDYLAQTNIVDEFLPRLFDLIVLQAVLNTSPSTFFVGQLLGLMTLEPHEADPTIFQVEHHRHVVHWDRFSKLIGDPGGLMREVYGWGTADLDVESLLLNLVNVLTTIGVSGATRALPAEVEAQLGGRSIAEAAADPDVQLFVSLFRGVGLDAADVGLSLFPLRPTVPGGLDAGIGLAPFAAATTEVEFALADRVSLVLDVSLDLERGVAALFRAGREPVLRTDLLAELDAVADRAGRLAATVRWREPPDERRVLIAAADGVGIDVAGYAIGAGITGALAPILTATIEGGRLVVAPRDPDGFLASILPPDGITVEFDLAVEWSRAGVSLRGGAGLETDIALNRAIATLRLRAIHLGIAARQEALHLEASVTATAAIGPITLAVERIGLGGQVELTPGNLGPVDAELDFKLPEGVGLSIDGGGFRGGGFLRREPDANRYVGAVELEFQDRIAIKAIGLLTTELPGGRSGFSLLVLISAEFTPIQLGFGFTLDGVGGLLGLNRTVRVERLETGLRDNTLENILFPTDVVANANRIISDLSEVYPPQADRFVFGPIAKIGWGTPTLITGLLGVVIEVPDPLRIVLPGVVKALLPDEETALLKLQVNFVGKVEIDKSLVSFDAAIYDSKLLSFPLDGDMAFRLAYGSNPNFLLTVGGFHPAYDPPPLALPALRRMTVQLLSGDNPRLTLETYFAITSNTIQFGAKVELEARSGKFNTYGFLAFDALFQINPFYVTAEIGAMLALRIGTRSIKSIKLSLTLEGPTPWTAAGTAKLKLFWFLTVKVRFNKTFGEVRDTRLDDVEVLPLVIRALESPGNWRAEAPPTSSRLVSTKRLPPGAETIVAHPDGVLHVSQKVVPLNIAIDRFGSQRPADATTFRIGPTEVDGLDLRSDPVEEQFAPAQFFDRTDSEKLAARAFEHYDAGVRIAGSEDLESSHYRRREVVYDLTYIDSQRNLSKRFDLRPFLATFQAWAAQGDAAQSPLSHRATAVSALAPDAVTVAAEEYAVVDKNDLTPIAPVATSEAHALQLMRQMITDDPELAGRIDVVPTFELAR